MTVRELSVTSAEPYEGGVDFGDAGPYELIKGTARIGLDPDDPANALIVDLASAREDVLRRVAGLPGLERPVALPIPRRLDLGPEADRGIGTYPPERGEAYPCLVAGRSPRW